MAIEIHLPRKYSRETLEMLRNNDGPNVIMTPGAVEVDIERNTDKSGLPVTKQSVLDIFNKQVIERINSLPKFSRDYYFISVGDLGDWHDNGLHAEFVEKLGNAFLSNEYGIMAVCDYLKLSDFVDREGDITIDDLANTFTNTINKLSSLCVFEITVSKNINIGANVAEYKGFAIGKKQTADLVNFSEVRNKLINSRDFNSVCKQWYRKILENAPKNKIIYKYYLPDPSPTGVKFFLKERNFGRPGPADERYPGENRIQFTSLFAHSISSAYFRIPKVTRPISAIIFNVNRHGGDHRHALSIVRPMLINEKNGTIVSEYNLQRSIYFGNDDGKLRIDFDKCVLDGYSYSTDLILTFEITTTGDRFDASWVYMEVESIIYGYNLTLEYNSNEEYHNREILLSNPPLPTLGNEIVKTQGSNNSAVYKYTVKDTNRRMSDIYFTLQNATPIHTTETFTLAVYRNGNKIGDGIAVYGNMPFRYHSHGWGYSPIIRVSVLHLDVKNGDEIVITISGGWNGFSERSVLKMVRILYSPFKEKQGGHYIMLINSSVNVMSNSYYGNNIQHLLTDNARQKYYDIID